MVTIRFDVRHRFDHPADVVWAELVDWRRHADWIPFTTIDIEDGDPTEVGRELTARTGFGPLALVDRMRVARCDWDAARSAGDCVVDKVGPVLHGRAGFTVEPDGSGCALDWFEDVSVRHVPQFVAPLGAWIGAFFFRQGMGRLAKKLST
ncbi:SRPBCC family protein [Ilumatobacter sp.]|uniref:SRPBCC family protein n=1 Tax=Ilumatobacter sp. TaxID=1967498 RepID=UPI003C58C372